MEWARWSPSTDVVERSRAEVRWTCNGTCLSKGHHQNWVTVGFNSPPVRIFKGSEGKLRCGKNTVFYMFFCLPPSRDFAKNREIP